MYLPHWYTNKHLLNHYISKVLPQAKQWIFSQISGDVYSAVLRDNSVVESTWKKYTDHVRAYARNTAVKHEVTEADVQPDEKFMQAIEQYLGIPEKDVFRKELSDAIASVSGEVLLSAEPSYQAAIKRFVTGVCSRSLAAPVRSWARPGVKANARGLPSSSVKA